MANTVAGGCYLSEDGKTYHDAKGKPVEKAVVSDAQKLNQAQAEDETKTWEANEEARRKAGPNQLGRQVMPTFETAQPTRKRQ